MEDLGSRRTPQAWSSLLQRWRFHAREAAEQVFKLADTQRMQIEAVPTGTGSGWAMALGLWHELTE